MAETWIKTMAEELHRLHKTQDGFDKFWNILNERGANTENKILYYEVLSWQGLERTKAYNNLSNKERTDLQNMLDLAFNWAQKVGDVIN